MTKNEARKMVFQKAWADAETAANEHGGKKSEYFGESLRAAWKAMKGLVKHAQHAKLWEKNGISRYYFNGLDEIIGLEFEYYKSGRICAASCPYYEDGLSNSKAADISFACSVGKVFFDNNTHEMVVNVKDIIDDAIRAAFDCRVEY